MLTEEAFDADDRISAKRRPAAVLTQLNDITVVECCLQMTEVTSCTAGEV